LNAIRVLVSLSCSSLAGHEAKGTDTAVHGRVARKDFAP
jgi:hypothetical protein